MLNKITNEVKKENKEVIKRINSIKRMTPKRLRKFKGFENLSKKEANDIIKTLETYCEIIVRHVGLKSKNNEEPKSI